ncbi:hypothetical protein IW262DRAFT_1247417, partial [Armillaria fumosa]
SFEIELPPELKRRGVHPVFHASLLRIHVPNNDELFPGRMDLTVGLPEAIDVTEWRLNRFVAHKGVGNSALFQAEWSSGDLTWLPHSEASKFPALQDYFEILGV